MRISDWSSDVCSSDLGGWIRRRQAAGHRCGRARTSATGLRRTPRPAAGLPGRARGRGGGGSCEVPLDQKTKAGTGAAPTRSEEHTSELQSLMRISYAVFCLKKKKIQTHTAHTITDEP